MALLWRCLTLLLLLLLMMMLFFHSFFYGEEWIPSYRVELHYFPEIYR